MPETRSARKRSLPLRLSIYFVEFMVVLVAIAAIGSLVSSAQTIDNYPLQISLSENCATAHYPSLLTNAAQLYGNVTVSGNYHGGPVSFSASIVMWIMSNSTIDDIPPSGVSAVIVSQNMTIFTGGNMADQPTGTGAASYMSGGFSVANAYQKPQYSIYYPNQTSASFALFYNYGGGNPPKDTCGFGSMSVYAYDQNNNVIGHRVFAGVNETETALSPDGSNNGILGADYITRYVVTLPTVPDSFFGIPLDFGGSPTQNGYGLPIVTGGEIFQELFYVSIIGLVLAATLSAIFGIFGNIGGGDGKGSIFYTMLTGSVFGLFAIIVMLPLYNIFAVMMNGLSYWILNPSAPTFNGAVATTNDLMSKGFTIINANGILSQGVWSVITGSFGAGLNAIAMFVLWLMIQLIVPLVGVARIFLIVAFVAIGPLIVILNIIPLTRHLAELLLSAIIGLMVAAPVSATFIALAAKIITPGAEPYGNLLVPGNGVFTFIVVAAGILGAAFIPMVLAPITGFFFQTLSQVGMGTAMTAMTVATAGAGGMGAGFVSGMSGGLQAASAMGKSGVSRLGMGLSQGMKGMAVVTPDVAKNMGLTVLGGVAGLAGASQAAKHIGYLGGGHTSFGQIGAKAGGVVGAANIASQMSGVHENLTGLMTTALPAGANWSNIKDASGKAFTKPKVNPDAVLSSSYQTEPDTLTVIAKDISQKWKAISRDQAWSELEAHSVIPKGIDRSNSYTSKPVDNFIGTMKQRISNLNPNNIDDAKQIVRLKNGFDVAQHIGRVPSAEELGKSLS